MPASRDAPAARHGAVLRAVWQQTPRVTLLTIGPEAAPPRPVLVPGTPATMHLPRHDATVHAAALAHMAAHQAHGGPPWARGRLRPLQLALLGALEDTRVEQQALRELPGLRMLWLPWHTATPHSGQHVEVLLQRLQRRLLDPQYQDPHPWIHKAWQLMQQADPGPAGLRQVASLLGHDLGQMRLPFDARAATAGPAYRDDNHHLWLPDEQPATSDTELTAQADWHRPLKDSTGADRPTPTTATKSPAAPTAQHPEWDHLIGRHRPRWCSVYEADMPPAADTRALTALLAAQAPLQQRLQRVLHNGAMTQTRRERAMDGPAFHMPSLVQAAVDQRLHRTPDVRLHSAARPRAAARPTLVLLDSSASTADPASPAWGRDMTLLQALGTAAWWTIQTLTRMGHQTGWLAFRSNGRHHVELLRLKALGSNDDGLGQLASLRSQGSTRLGAAVRHACWLLRGQPGAHVLLLTDGEPHDIDVFDRRYLLDDLRQAVTAAQRRGIRVTCLAAGATPSPALRRAFAPGACRPLQSWRALPEQLRHVLHRARG